MRPPGFCSVTGTAEPVTEPVTSDALLFILLSPVSPVSPVNLVYVWRTFLQCPIYVRVGKQAGDTGDTSAFLALVTGWVFLFFTGDVGDTGDNVVFILMMARIPRRAVSLRDAVAASI